MDRLHERARSRHAKRAKTRMTTEPATTAMMMMVEVEIPPESRLTRKETWGIVLEGSVWRGGVGMGDGGWRKECVERSVDGERR